MQAHRHYARSHRLASRLAADVDAGPYPFARREPWGGDAPMPRPAGSRLDSAAVPLVPVKAPKRQVGQALALLLEPRDRDPARGVRRFTGRAALAVPSPPDRPVQHAQRRPRRASRAPGGEAPQHAFAAAPRPSASKPTVEIVTICAPGRSRNAVCQESRAPHGRLHAGVNAATVTAPPAEVTRSSGVRRAARGRRRRSAGRGAAQDTRARRLR